MFKEIKTYGYNDVGIKGSVVSDIQHRAECNVFKENGKLPLFTAPMTNVVNEKNYQIFEDNKINAILPRNIKLEDRMFYLEKGMWVGFSANEFIEFVDNNTILDYIPHILIDAANGNMLYILEYCKKAKIKFGYKNIVLMYGNISNAKTYDKYCEYGVDYCRCSVGTGNGCITSTQTGIHCGIVSIIDEAYKIKKEVESYIKKFGNSHYICVTNIVADGGIRGYADVIKALALGADYVMIGSLFCQLLESSAETYYLCGNDKESRNYIDVFDENILIEKNDGETFDITWKVQGKLGELVESCKQSKLNLIKLYYGMASRRGQIDLYGKKKSTVEGTEKWLPCISTIKSWSENMQSYLASSMSYCGIRNLKYFNQDKVETVLLSENVKQSINK
jgi:hypothetical protein